MSLLKIMYNETRRMKYIKYKSDETEGQHKGGGGGCVEK